MTPSPGLAASLALAVFVGLAVAAQAQGPNTREPPAIVALQKAKFPQPVRVGDLATWPVIASGGRYRHLGEVVGVFRQTGGGDELVFRNGDLWGLGGRLVATPLEQVALVGPMVRVEMDQGDIDDLPAFKARNGAFLRADDHVRIGLDKKY
jgi:hypothetical protein